MLEPQEISLEIVGIDDIIDFRTRLLRPSLWPDERAYFEGDIDATTVHAALMTGNKDLVAIATFQSQPAPFAPQQAAIRLRGMAVDTPYQSQGYGSRLLNAMFGLLAVKFPDHDIIWCNARETAVTFYEKLGFQIEGERFDIAPVGPHYVMWRKQGMAIVN